MTVAGSDYHGPGWACGYNKSASLISDCIGHGFVGDYDTYKDSPTTAPAAMHTSAVCHKRSNYDTEENTVDWTLPSYYDWELKQTVALHPGVKYTYYEFTNLPRKMHVLELDLTNDAVEISTSMADDLVPNPNGNNNSNNGKTSARHSRKTATGSVPKDKTSSPASIRASSIRMTDSPADCTSRRDAPTSSTTRASARR